MVVRVLRVVAVASILAFGLTARAASTAQAHDAAAELATVVESPAPEPVEQVQTDLPPADLPPAEPPPVEPPPVEPPPVEPPPVEPPPVEPPPVEPPPVEPPPVEPPPVEPPPVEPPPVEPPPVEPPPVEHPVNEGPPPSDPVEPPLADPPPVEPPILVEPPPPIPDTTGEPPLPVADPVVTDPYPAGRPSVLSPAVVSPDAERPAGRSAAPAPEVAPAARSVAAEPATPTHSTTPDKTSAWAGQPPRGAAGVPQHEFMPVAAGIAAGLAVTNRTPVSVAVAIEFGRAGGGWAGAIVFNLWLRRQLRERQMSQRQLAALSGVDHSTISRLLLKDRRPSLATATKLAAALRHVDGEQAEADAADYFERIPAETLFPARRVEMALRADELLDDDEVRHLMMMYLNARRKRQMRAAAGGHSSNGHPTAMSRSPSTSAGQPTRAGPTRGDT